MTTQPMSPTSLEPGNRLHELAAAVALLRTEMISGERLAAVLDQVGSAVLQVIPGLPATGWSASALIPVSLVGNVLRLQGFAVSPAAANGIFATTAAHDLVFY